MSKIATPDCSVCLQNVPYVYDLHPLTTYDKKGGSYTLHVTSMEKELLGDERLQSIRGHHWSASERSGTPRVIRFTSISRLEDTSSTEQFAIGLFQGAWGKVPFPKDILNQYTTKFIHFIPDGSRLNIVGFSGTNATIQIAHYLCAADLARSLAFHRRATQPRCVTCRQEVARVATDLAIFHSDPSSATFHETQPLGDLVSPESIRDRRDTLGDHIRTITVRTASAEGEAPTLPAVQRLARRLSPIVNFVISQFDRCYVESGDAIPVMLGVMTLISMNNRSKSSRIMAYTAFVLQVIALFKHSRDASKPGDIGPLASQKVGQYGKTIATFLFCTGVFKLAQLARKMRK